jgi:CRP-like cAMP-binding protein
MSRQATIPDLTNHILRALPRASLERLAPHLDFVDLGLKEVIPYATRSIDHLYFVDRGLVSLVKTMLDGRTVEVGAVGIEGAVGLFALHGVASPTWEALVQEPGAALRIRVDAFRSEMLRSESVRHLIERYTYVAVSDLAQTAACNRLHSLEERCCRWLLVAHDNAMSDTFALTQEFLAHMLGVQRSGLSTMANALQKAGLIRYARGQITVTDRHALEARTCECYQTMRSLLNQVRQSTHAHSERRWRRSADAVQSSRGSLIVSEPFRPSSDYRTSLPTFQTSDPC